MALPFFCWRSVTDKRFTAGWTPIRAPWRGAAWLLGAIAALAAAVVAVVLAVGFFLLAVIATVSLAISAAFMRMRGRRGTGDSSLIEARHVGGHSWIAYGWDERR